MIVGFEWDGEKNLINFKKHGVWFVEAQTIWNDEMAVEFFDLLHSTHEDRFIRVGRTAGAIRRVLLVVFCERENGKVIRIISAREATAYEQRDYEEGIRS